MGFLSKLGDFVAQAYGHPDAKSRIAAIVSAQNVVGDVQNQRRLDEEMVLRRARQALEEKDSEARRPGIIADSTMAGQKSALASLGLRADMEGRGTELPDGQAGPPEPTEAMDAKQVVPGVDGGMSVMDLFKVRGAADDREIAAETAKHNIGKTEVKGIGMVDPQDILHEQGADRRNAASIAAANARGGNFGGGHMPTAADIGWKQEAVDMKARELLEKGTVALPRSKNMDAVMAVIQNRAAEMDPNASLAASASDYKANSGSQAALTKQSDSISAFENTASQNAKLLDGVTQRIPDLGVKYGNMLVRDAANQFGSEDMAAFDTLRTSVATEYARIITNVNGGVLSDSARNELHKVLDPNSTINQMLTSLATLKAEAGNRLKSFDTQLGDVKDRIHRPPGTGTGSKSADPLEDM